MANIGKRDNGYYLERLKNAGREDLLAAIKAGEMSVYKATTVAGLRKKRSVPSRADQISYHYSRATLAEKRRFILDNWSSLTQIASYLFNLQKRSQKAQNSSEQEKK